MGKQNYKWSYYVRATEKFNRVCKKDFLTIKDDLGIFLNKLITIQLCFFKTFLQS